MNKYWRNRLDREGDKCYGHILRGIHRHSNEVDCGNVKVESVKNAYFAIYNDHPELFYLSNSPQVAQLQKSFSDFGIISSSCSAIISSIYSKEEIDSCERKIENVKRKISKKVNSRMTDEEKAIIVAEYLVCNTVYEINNLYNQNAASALCFGKAQCSGMSKAFKLLMDYLGVYCICVNGDAIDERGNKGPHAWNIVKIGEKYYHIDVTFMIGANRNKSEQIVRMYLFYDDSSMASDHLWDKDFWPICDDNSRYLNDFEKKGFFADRKSSPGKSSANDLCIHFSSLGALRDEIKQIIKNRKASVFFYLDVGVNNTSEILRVVQNAVKMVAEKEEVSCSFEISVFGSSLVNIEIKY